MFLHRDDLIARHGQHDVRAASRIRMFFSKLQHCSALTAWHKANRSDDATLSDNALGVLKGRTRPVRPFSLRRMAPPEPPL